MRKSCPLQICSNQSTIHPFKFRPFGTNTPVGRHARPTANCMQLMRSRRNDGSGYSCIAHVSCLPISIPPPPAGHTKPLVRLSGSTVLSCPKVLIDFQAGPYAEA